MRENYKGYPWFGRQKIWHQYPLTDAEKLELAAKMAEARAEMSRLEDELAFVTVEGCEEIVRRPMRPSERQPGLFYDSARLAGDVEKLKGGKHGGSQEEYNGEC